MSAMEWSSIAANIGAAIAGISTLLGLLLSARKRRSGAAKIKYADRAASTQPHANEWRPRNARILRALLGAMVGPTALCALAWIDVVERGTLPIDARTLFSICIKIAGAQVFLFIGFVNLWMRWRNLEFHERVS